MTKVKTALLYVYLSFVNANGAGGKSVEVAYIIKWDFFCMRGILWYFIVFPGLYGVLDVRLTLQSVATNRCPCP